jgi:molecular chaperone GrpE
LVSDLERVTQERDEYLKLAQSKQAEFENFRKRSMKQQADEVARSSAKLVEALLPVLDAFDYGIGHGDESLVPMRAQLLAALEREGLVRLDSDGAPFDPMEHEAVAHEPGDGGDSVVIETMRAGYRWQGHLLRPAMVKVRD